MKYFKFALVLSFLVLSLFLFTACPANGGETSLLEIDGVWKVTEYLDSQGDETFRYIIVDEANEIIEMWSDFGFIERHTVAEERGNTLMLTSLHYYNHPEWEGNTIRLDWTLTDSVLLFDFGPEDGGEAWQWRVNTEAAAALPDFSMEYDFEDDDVGLLEPADIEGNEAWQIIEDPADSNNKILAPLYGNANANFYIHVAPWKNYSLNAKVKSLKSTDGNDGNWFHIKMFDYNSEGEAQKTYGFKLHSANDLTIEFNDEDLQNLYLPLHEWDTWYDLSIVVVDGDHYFVSINGDLTARGVFEEPLEITAIHVYGNPVTAITHIDDFDLQWQRGSLTEPVFDYSEMTMLTCYGGDVFMAVPDGSRFYQLTDNSYGEWYPQWIPGNDEEILLVRNAPSVTTNIDIYKLNIVTGEETCLTTTTFIDSLPHLHPDGNTFVFQSDRDGDDDIYKYNLDLDSIRQISNNAAEEKHPRYSPDGTEIVFISDESGNEAIWTMDSDGTNRTRITPTASPWDTLEANEPDWSPDGLWFVFAARNPASDTQTIYRVPSDGSADPTQIFDTPESGSPRYNGDGTFIYFQYDGAIWRMDADGQNEAELVPQPHDSTRWFYNFDFR